MFLFIFVLFKFYCWSSLRCSTITSEWILFALLLFPLSLSLWKSECVSLVAYQWVHMAFQSEWPFWPYRQKHCVRLWESIFHLATWQHSQTSLGRFVVCLCWGSGWKWNGGAHTTETESTYLICSVLISPVILPGIKEGELCSLDDDETIKGNSSWQTHGINKLTLRKRKRGLASDSESVYGMRLPLSARPSVAAYCKFLRGTWILLLSNFFLGHCSCHQVSFRVSSEGSWFRLQYNEDH